MSGKNSGLLKNMGIDFDGFDFKRDSDKICLVLKIESPCISRKLRVSFFVMWDVLRDI